jgi:hypothetical protein
MVLNDGGDDDGDDERYYQNQNRRMTFEVVCLCIRQHHPALPVAFLIGCPVLYALKSNLY